MDELSVVEHDARDHVGLGAHAFDSVEQDDSRDVFSLEGLRDGSMMHAMGDRHEHEYEDGPASYDYEDQQYQHAWGTNQPQTQ